ncbi:MAG: PilZ domain [Acidimicrobiia bacterium]|nr:PilZ domain [Acidimicrobiia bacterium]
MRAPVRIAHGPEQFGALGHTIDISPDGLLVCLPPTAEPARQADSILVSIALDDGLLHLLGIVRRCARGGDRNWYVAVEYTQLDPNDRDRLDQLVGETNPPTS